MRYYPIFLDLRDRKAVVVGGGEEALRKVRLLLKTEAQIELVAPSLHDELAAEPRVAWIARRFEPRHLDGAAVVYSADKGLDEAVAVAAMERRIPVNVIDNAEQSSFITPSIVDRDPVVVAIGTEGTAPLLGQGIRARIDAMLPIQIGRLARAASALRPHVAATVPGGNRRRGFWQRFFFGAIRDAFLADDTKAYDVALNDALSGESKPPVGRVAIVGAGPGDPELMTLKAQRLLQEADLIVHAEAVGSPLLELARRDAVRAVLDEESEAASLLIAEAGTGKRVVWLCPGDGSVIGAATRAALSAAGIALDVVPGVAAPAQGHAADVVPFPIRDELRSSLLRAVS